MKHMELIFFIRRVFLNKPFKSPVYFLINVQLWLLVLMPQTWAESSLKDTGNIGVFYHWGLVHFCLTWNISIKVSIYNSPFWLNARLKTQPKHCSCLLDILCLPQRSLVSTRGYHEESHVPTESSARLLLPLTQNSPLIATLTGLCHRYGKVFPVFQKLTNSESYFKPWDPWFYWSTLIISSRKIFYNLFLASLQWNIEFRAMFSSIIMDWKD